jgi:hypothetical protein
MSKAARAEDDDSRNTGAGVGLVLMSSALDLEYSVENWVDKSAIN